MAWVNFYNCLNASGTTLTDSIGTHNGTLAGASLPTINSNGYLSFVGSHNTTQGDWSRVVLTDADYQYLTQSTFTLILKFRTSSTAAAYEHIFSMINFNDSGAYLFIRKENDHKIHIAERASGGNSKAYLNEASIFNNGKWHIVIMKSSLNSMVVFIDGKQKTLTTDLSLTTGQTFYKTNSKALLGASYYHTGTTYAFDYTGDISYFSNKNDAMSIGAIKTYSAYLQGMV